MELQTENFNQISNTKFKQLMKIYQFPNWQVPIAPTHFNSREKKERDLRQVDEFRDYLGIAAEHHCWCIIIARGNLRRNLNELD